MVSKQHECSRVQSLMNRWRRSRIFAVMSLSLIVIRRLIILLGIQKLTEKYSFCIKQKQKCTEIKYKYRSQRHVIRPAILWTKCTCTDCRWNAAAFCVPTHTVKNCQNAVIYLNGVPAPRSCFPIHQWYYMTLENVHTMCRIMVLFSSVLCGSPLSNSPSKSSSYISTTTSIDNGWPVTHTTKAATSCHVVRSK